jgi:hypothetical protein
MLHTHIPHLYVVWVRVNWVSGVMIETRYLRAKMHSLGSGVWDGGMFYKNVRSILSYLIVLSLSSREAGPSPKLLSF